jgi:hypothetical protein
MVYNNTTTKAGLIQRYERHSQLGDGVVSGDDTLLRQTTADINETLYDLTNRIILSHDNFDWDDPYKTDYPIATTPLIASQRDYQFDNISFLKLKRVDVSYDGTNYYRATPFDSATYQEGLGNDTNTDDNFSKNKPYYDPKSFGFWLYPLADATDVSNGGKIRVEFTRAYTEYVYDDTTKEPPIDRPFHDLIAIGAALKLPSLTVDQYNKLLIKYQQGVAELEAYYGTRNEDFYMDINPQLETYT